MEMAEYLQVAVINQLRIARVETRRVPDVHTVYMVEIATQASTWTVAHRYSEFEALQAKLKRRLPPRTQQPSLPGKSILSMSEKVVDIRRRGLETYLRELLLALYQNVPGLPAKPGTALGVIPLALSAREPMDDDLSWKSCVWEVARFLELDVKDDCASTRKLSLNIAQLIPVDYHNPSKPKPLAFSGHQLRCLARCCIKLFPDWRPGMALPQTPPVLTVPQDVIVTLNFIRKVVSVRIDDDFSLEPLSPNSDMSSMSSEEQIYSPRSISDGPLDVAMFESAINLTFNFVDPTSIRGLATLQPKLQSVVCKDSICSLKEILMDAIDAGHNEGVIIPSWSSLKKLDVSENQIGSFNETATKIMPIITELNAGHNRIKKIENLQWLSSLNALHVPYNLLSSLEDIHLALGNIHVLTISHNRIESLAGLERLPSLHELDVSFNAISEMNEFNRLTQLPFLVALHARGNPCHPEVDTVSDFRVHIFGHFGGRSTELFLDHERMNAREMPFVRELQSRLESEKASEQSIAAVSGPVSVAASAARKSKKKPASSRVVDFNGNTTVAVMSRSHDSAALDNSPEFATTTGLSSRNGEHAASAITTSSHGLGLNISPPSGLRSEDQPLKSGSENAPRTSDRILSPIIVQSDSKAPSPSSSEAYLRQDSGTFAEQSDFEKKVANIKEVTGDQWLKVYAEMSAPATKNQISGDQSSSPVPSASSVGVLSGISGSLEVDTSPSSSSPRSVNSKKKTTKKKAEEGKPPGSKKKGPRVVDISGDGSEVVAGMSLANDSTSTVASLSSDMSESFRPSSSLSGRTTPAATVPKDSLVGNVSDDQVDSIAGGRDRSSSSLTPALEYVVLGWEAGIFRAKLLCLDLRAKRLLELDAREGGQWFLSKSWYRDDVDLGSLRIPVEDLYQSQKRIDDKVNERMPTKNVKSSLENAVIWHLRSREVDPEKVRGADRVYYFTNKRAYCDLMFVLQQVWCHEGLSFTGNQDTNLSQLSTASPSIASDRSRRLSSQPPPLSPIQIVACDDGSLIVQGKSICSIGCSAYTDLFLYEEAAEMIAAALFADPEQSTKPSVILQRWFQCWGSISEEPLARILLFYGSNEMVALRWFFVKQGVALSVIYRCFYISISNITVGPFEQWLRIIAGHKNGHDVEEIPITLVTKDLGKTGALSAWLRDYLASQDLHPQFFDGPDAKDVALLRTALAPYEIDSAVQSADPNLKPNGLSNAQIRLYASVFWMTTKVSISQQTCLVVTTNWMHLVVEKISREDKRRSRYEVCASASVDEIVSIDIFSTRPTFLTVILKRRPQASSSQASRSRMSSGTESAPHPGHVVANSFVDSDEQPDFSWELACDRPLQREVILKALQGVRPEAEIPVVTNR